MDEDASSSLSSWGEDWAGWVVYRIGAREMVAESVVDGGGGWEMLLCDGGDGGAAGGGCWVDDSTIRRA